MPGIEMREESRMATKLLLICGALSSLLYIAMNIVVPMQWPGYSAFSQVVSELSAIDAPTRTLWVVLVVPYGLLLLAFAWGIWRSARESRSLRIVAALMFIGGVIGFAWPPMHVREVLAAGRGTLSDQLHIAFTVVWGVFALLEMGFAAAAFGRRFRVYTIASAIILLLFGGFTGMYGTRISANLPTPWVGVWERINIGVFMVWVIVLAIGLLRRQAATAPRNLPKQPTVRTDAPALST
jgi:hypothetical membrane protein